MQRTHVLSTAARGRGSVAAAMMAITARSRGLATTAVLRATEALFGAIEAAMLPFNDTAWEDTPLHIRAMCEPVQALSNVRRLVTVGHTGEHGAAALAEGSDNAHAHMASFRRQIAEATGWDVTAVRPGKIFALCAVQAGLENQARAWGLLNGAAMVIGAAQVVLNEDADADAMAAAQKAAEEALVMVKIARGEW